MNSYGYMFTCKTVGKPTLAFQLLETATVPSKMTEHLYETYLPYDRAGIPTLPDRHILKYIL